MVLKIIISLLFLLFAVVQFNDPDPLLWVLLYSSISILWGISIFKPIPKIVLHGSLIVIFIWLLFLIPGFVHWVKMGMPTITSSMKAEAPHIELTREFLGLAIAGLSLWWLKSKNDNFSNQ